MSTENDIALEMAQESAAAALKDFQATLASFQNRANPDPAKRPVGGVALPHMGARPGAPPLPPRPGVKPAPNGGASAASAVQLKAKADQLALQAMMEARRDFIPNLFKNAEIRYKSGKSPADDAKTAAEDFKKSAKSVFDDALKDIKSGRSVAPTSSAAKTADLGAARTLGTRAFQLLSELDPGDFAALQGTIEELFGDIFTDLGSSLLPYVSTAKAGYGALSAWAETGSKQRHVQATKHAKEKLIQGDPSAAIASLQRLLERERNLLAGEAAIKTAKLGADVTGYFIDLGIATSVVTGSVEAIGRLTLHIRMIVRDAK
jgi:hypothetical protein